MPTQFFLYLLSLIVFIFGSHNHILTMRSLLHEVHFHCTQNLSRTYPLQMALFALNRLLVLLCTHVCPDRPWGQTSLLYNGYRFFPEGKERPGRAADPSHPSGAVVMKGYSYTSTPL
jgi:hypothetical protein